MKPPHRIRIYSAMMARDWRLWYVTCKCGWQIGDSARAERRGLWGRRTWDAALAIGVAHLRQECKHV